MHLAAAATQAYEFCLDLLFPIFCISCGKENAFYLCHKCQKTIRKNEFQLCPECGKRSAFGIAHPACKKPLGLDGLISALPYNQPLTRKIVELLKYQFVKDAAPIMADLICDEVANLEMQKYFSEFTLLPVPLHPTRLKWRGFNQSELVARNLVQNFGAKMDTALLSRTKRTKVQAELEDRERPENVKNAFDCPEVSGKFIIVDDVSNTRSTLNDACRALKSSGAAEVWGLVFAQG